MMVNIDIFAIPIPRAECLFRTDQDSNSPHRILILAHGAWRARSVCSLLISSGCRPSSRVYAVGARAERRRRAQRRSQRARSAQRGAIAASKEPPRVGRGGATTTRPEWRRLFDEALRPAHPLLFICTFTFGVQASIAAFKLLLTRFSIGAVLGLSSATCLLLTICFWGMHFYHGVKALQKEGKLAQTSSPPRGTRRHARSRSCKVTELERWSRCSIAFLRGCR